MGLEGHLAGGWRKKGLTYVVVEFKMWGDERWIERKINTVQSGDRCFRSIHT